MKTVTKIAISVPNPTFQAAEETSEIDPILQQLQFASLVEDEWYYAFG